MAQIQSYHESIQGELQTLNRLINKSGLFTTNKKKWKDDCNKLITKIKQDIEACDDKMSQMSKASTRQFIPKNKQLKNQLDKCIQQYQNKIKQEKTIINNNHQKNQIYNNPTASLIQKGDETNQRIDQSINNMFKITHEGISMADEINLNLSKQIQQLDRIHSKVKDTQSTLKRAQKTINYFVRAMECDKCMIGLVLLNLLAIIALITLIIKKSHE